MSKAPPPLLGFNNNVRHRGRIFHIQTEDSGIKFPRIVTHLFADGGRIVKTTRTDYSEQIEKPNMAGIVRGLMKEQHKAMFAALRAGALDAVLEQICGPLEAAKGRPASSEDPTATNDLATARVVVSSQTRGEPVSAAVPVASAVADGVRLAEAQATLEGVNGSPDADGSPRKVSITNPNLRKPTPSAVPAPREAFDLDVASLDKNPPRVALTGPPNPRSARKSTPPRKSSPPIPARTAPAAAAPPVTAAAAEVASTSVTRPQTRLAAAPPAASRSIFGDGAISEQSLDEVILSYLAEDLEESK